MNNDLLKLIKIAEIDKKASAKEPEIAAIEEELELKVKELNSLEWDLEAIRSDIKKSKLEIANSELAIAENSDKIAQNDVKMSNAKSERELRILEAESGIAKEKITFSNQIIADLEAKIDNFKEKEGEIQGKMDDLKMLIDETKKSVEARVAVIQNELKTIFYEKEVIAKQIDNKVIVFYEKIRKWAKDTSVVPVKRQACSGCFICINDRIYLELIKSEVIVTCPHCGRILYLEPNEIVKNAESSADSAKKLDSAAESSAKKSTKKSDSAKSAPKPKKSESKKSAESKKSTTKSTAKSATKSASAKSAKSSTAKKSTAKKATKK